MSQLMLAIKLPTLMQKTPGGKIKAVLLVITGR
jgi:hypothetical protein